MYRKIVEDEVHPMYWQDQELTVTVTKVKAKNGKDVSKNSGGRSPSNVLARSGVDAPLQIMNNSNNILEEISNESTESGPQPPQNSPAAVPQMPETLGKTPKKASFENSIEKPAHSASRPLLKPAVKEIKILKATEKIHLHDNSGLLAHPPSGKAKETSKCNSKTSRSSISKFSPVQNKVMGNVDGDLNDLMDGSEMGNEEETDGNQETFDSTPNSLTQLVLKTVRTIEKQNQMILRQNKQILARLPDTNVEELMERRLYEPLTGFPISTVEQFNNLDSVDNIKLRKQVYNHLLCLGGSQVREFLHTALKAVMTDELVTQFTWPKSKNNLEFGNTRVANVLYQAAKNCPLFKGPYTKKEFKTEMVEVIRASKQRHRNLGPQNEESIREEIRRLQEMVEKADEDSQSGRGGEEDEEFADDEFADDEEY